MLHDILKILYRHCPGRLEIMRKEYTITNDETNGVILDDDNWSALVKPGMQVSLNIILKAASTWDLRICPRCKSPILNVESSGDGIGAARRWCVLDPKG